MQIKNKGQEVIYMYLKYLFIVLFIYLAFDIAEYLVLRYVKRVEYKNYFDYLKCTHKIFKKLNKDNKNDNINNAE